MEVRVDRRVELLSILFHLAGSEEYRAFDTPYRRAVDAYFAPFAGHASVAATRELRAAHSISYNAPVGLAVFLDGATLEPQVALDGAPELDPRWRGVSIRDYLATVREFSRAANVGEFFASQRPYFEAVEQRMVQLLADQQIERWFADNLATAAAASYVLVPGLLTGPWNYDAATHDAAGRHRMYQIVELEGVDPRGLPVPTQTTAALIAHEVAHSYVNPVVERHADALVAAIAPRFERVREQMAQQHYGTPLIAIEESVVRALAALFARDRLGRDVASKLVLEDEAHGFTWNIELAKWLDAHPRPLDLDALAPDLVRWFAQ